MSITSVFTNNKKVPHQQNPAKSLAILIVIDFIIIIKFMAIVNVYQNITLLQWLLLVTFLQTASDIIMLPSDCQKGGVRKDECEIIIGFGIKNILPTQRHCEMHVS